jgi:argininosuccinate lyase
MPTTVATWLGSFVAASEDNELLLRSVLALVDQSPLGTAAGFGVPVLPIDRQMTSDLLGFAKVQENPIYAQLSRGKFEAMILDACTAVLYDLNRLASDLLLFQTKEFSFVMLPTELCTGSSIMPQKKNPDVLELLRAKYHAVLGDAFQIKSLPANLISGYNRDLQLTKGPLIRGLKTTHECLRIMSLVLDRLRIDEAACKNAMSEEIYATEQAYELVLQGMPFRDAYRKVAERFDSN